MLIRRGKRYTMTFRKLPIHAPTDPSQRTASANSPQETSGNAAWARRDSNRIVTSAQSQMLVKVSTA